MGEENMQGSVSRGVDSSLERLEVKVKNMSDPNLMLICNGKYIPLSDTQEIGTKVAGVRFKAWAPHSALHPNIPIHTPLVFDLIDKRYGRSLGGCTYHVIHPGGRNYDSLPVNENEAEGRRISRFQASGQTPGKIAIPQEFINNQLPVTLDLRL